MVEESTPRSLSPTRNIAEALINAIAEQSEYAEDHQITWDRFGSLSAYVCSFYGFSTMFLAFILNRTAIFATARSNSRPRPQQIHNRGFLGATSREDWPFALCTMLLRLSAVAGLAFAMRNVLVVLRIMKENAQDQSALPTLVRLIPDDWFLYDPVKYATDKYMSMSPTEVRFGPTSSMLWPVYLAASYSEFIEVFVSSISGKTPKIGRAITILELSVSLQEVSSGFYFLREYTAAKRPTEQVLMVCMFSLTDHILQHLGSLLYGRKYRLIPSSIVSVLFISYHWRCLRNGSWFYFPVVIISAYTSLLFLWAVIISCALIFILAIIAKGSKYEELQFASYFSSSEEGSEFFSKHIGCSFDDDFFSFSSKLSLFAITSAGRSSYITEYNYVTGAQSTWVEQSITDKLVSIFGAGSLTKDADSVRSGKVLAYLKENRMSGYGNLVEKPPLRLISRTKDEKFNFKLQGAWKQRWYYLSESAVRFYQLLKSLIVNSFAFYLVPRLFRKYILRRPINLWGSNDETEEEFRIRQSRAPKFVQPFIKKREPVKDPAPKFNINEVPEDQLVTQYSCILQEYDLDEEDESPDFILEVEDGSDLESDSDLESVDLTQGIITRSNRAVTQATPFTSALGELITSENLLDMLQGDADLLTRHLNYDYAKDGIMTRSRYRARNKPGVHEAEELLDLILTKRAKQEHKAPRQGDNEIDKDDEDYDLDARLACVVCQIHLREIITWPCKCFAICESCRLSLMAKNMEGCVCCRRDVEGVSRVYLP
ncbi:hypothetical protein FT663_03893 [Candidozyma haemuli var. vulneris]|nr:hypothetical protein FT662_03966 [[Candida] haemuloni var. vulneris]KAF3988788.1 hypothetical protein FT663_03893 [[Candida] haemuloni var. vulneris]